MKRPKWQAALLVTLLRLVNNQSGQALRGVRARHCHHLCSHRHNAWHCRPCYRRLPPRIS